MLPACLPPHAGGRAGAQGWVCLYMTQAGCPGSELLALFSHWPGVRACHGPDSSGCVAELPGGPSPQTPPISYWGMVGGWVRGTRSPVWVLLLVLVPPVSHPEMVLGDRGSCGSLTPSSCRGGLPTLGRACKGLPLGLASAGAARDDKGGTGTPSQLPLCAQEPRGQPPIPWMQVWGGCYCAAFTEQAGDGDVDWGQNHTSSE